jgi:rhomboid family GlyGly-CTERM serine protease
MLAAVTAPPARDLDRTFDPDRASGARPWVALCAVLLGGALLGTLAPASALDWQPTRAALEPWRWWTAAFVHLSPLHLGANALGTLVVAWLGWSARLPARLAFAWLLAWPVGHLALGWVAPTLAHYGGLSGVLHAGVAAAAVHLMIAPAEGACDAREARRRRVIGVGIAAVLAAKLVLEAPWGAPARSVEGWDIPVAPIAHTTGAVAAALLALLIELASRRWRRQAPSASALRARRPPFDAPSRPPRGGS